MLKLSVYKVTTVSYSVNPVEVSQPNISIQFSMTADGLKCNGVFMTQSEVCTCISES